jgi:hypothetical protein
VIRRWITGDGLGRRLVILGLLGALAAGILVSLTTSSPPEYLSTVGFKTHYGPQPRDTTLSTLLSSGEASGRRIAVPKNTAVTDSASLRGSNVSTATGMVTYRVYSDDDCDSPAISSDSVGVTAGSIPASTAVSLSAPGTYYWQASYSGDSNNEPSKSPCGSEQEIVTNGHPRHHRHHR